MSGERALRAEIESLRSALEALRVRVEVQEERIEELAGRGPAGSEFDRSSIAAASEESATRGSYSVVSSSAGRGTVATEDTAHSPCQRDWRLRGSCLGGAPPRLQWEVSVEFGIEALRDLC